MTTKFIVTDGASFHQLPTARVFEYEDKLKEYLTEYGTYGKKIYRVDKEITFQLNPSLDQE